MPALLGGKVAGVDRVLGRRGRRARRRRPGFRQFRVDEFGAPSYPELVLCVTHETLRDKPALVRATVAALQRGYRFTLEDPESSASDLLSQVPPASRDEIMAQLDVLDSVFLGPTGVPGALDPGSAARLGAVGGAVRDHAPAAGRGRDVRHALRERSVGGSESRRRRASRLARAARRNASRADSGRPHICTTSTRPPRTSRRTSSPSMPASSSRRSVPCTAGTAAAWPKRCATRMRQCQSCLEYGCALHVTR